MASRSTKFYQKNKKARDLKNAYNRAYYNANKESLNSSRAERKKFSENNNVKEGDDVSHTPKGLTTKPRRINRGSKSDMPGDRRARGKGVKKARR